MVVLYPIKPIYIDRILSGEKTCELRKRLPKKSPQYILLYSTWPVKQVVGYASVLETYKKCVHKLWNQVSSYAGIDEDSYFEYFQNADNACALKFNKVYKFSDPFNLSEIREDFKAPQSFCYLNKDIFESIMKKEAIEV
ncbi:MAG: hypothetical protein OCD00_10370 [Colwellia sp.]